MFVYMKQKGFSLWASADTTCKVMELLCYNCVMHYNYYIITPHA